MADFLDDFRKRIAASGLKKKFIAEKLNMDDTYFSTFFSKARTRRPMPKHIRVKLGALLAKY